MANDCPLAGTISDNTLGGGPWKCWAHDRVHEASQWPWLTQGIRANLWLFEIADLAGRIPLFDLEQRHGDKRIDEFLERRGRPDLMRWRKSPLPPEAARNPYWNRETADEPRPFWVKRLRNAAFDAAWEVVRENWRGVGPAGEGARDVALEAISAIAAKMRMARPPNEMPAWVTEEIPA
jgi:hypothetical protein